MHYIVLLFVSCPAVPCLSTLFHKRHVFREEHDVCALIISLFLSEIFLILRRIRQDTVINAHTYSCEVLVILARG
jgi:hypothetical protein